MYGIDERSGDHMRHVADCSRNEIMLLICQYERQSPQ